MNELQEVIESCKQYVSNIPTGVLHIAEKLREDNIQAALLDIKDFSEGLLWLSQASELISRNGLEMNLDITKIQHFLIDINEGLVRQDYIVVTDILEYEIAPFFEELNQKGFIIQ